MKKLLIKLPANNNSNVTNESTLDQALDMVRAFIALQAVEYILVPSAQSSVGDIPETKVRNV